MIDVGIIGGAGYVAGELIRCLLHHPKVHINFLYSHSQTGKKVSDIHQDIVNDKLLFSDKINHDVNIIFLCLGHGKSREFLENHSFSTATKIIDLSNDFRLSSNASFLNKKFIYGLVEFNKSLIKKASYIANPGCFATAIQLGLVPLAKAKLLQNPIHVHAITGSTGAGQSLSPTSHFSWRSNNISTYKPFVHQHLDEIIQSLNIIQKEIAIGHINFLPIRGNFTRGIFANMYCDCPWTEEELKNLFIHFYKDAKFVFVKDHTIHLKQVQNTNYCFLQVQKIDGKVLITSVIDNLLKGAVGQAIQNMNLMFDFPETQGLSLKASFF